MPFCDVLIGEEAGAFSWSPTNDAYRICNLPKMLGRFPHHPDLPGYGLWSIVFNRMQDGTYPGQQVDWGAWAAKVSRADILALVEEFYPETFGYPSYLSHFEKSLVEFRTLIASLADQHYILVAVESG